MLHSSSSESMVADVYLPHRVFSNANKIHLEHQENQDWDLLTVYVPEHQNQESNIIQHLENQHIINPNMHCDGKKVV